MQSFGTILAYREVRKQKELGKMETNTLVMNTGKSIRTIVKDTMGVDQLYTIMNVLRSQYNRTTDRGRRTRMARVIDVAAAAVVHDFRRCYLEHNEEDSD